MKLTISIKTIRMALAGLAVLSMSACPMRLVCVATPAGFLQTIMSSSS